MAQQQAVNKFVLGSKELEGKNAEFQYDKGWYSITDIVGEERNVIYKSRNAQEAYMKWNVYIGRKKERPVPENRKNDNGADRVEHRDSGRNNQREKRNNRDNRVSIRNIGGNTALSPQGDTICCKMTKLADALFLRDHQKQAAFSISSILFTFVLKKSYVQFE